VHKDPLLPAPSEIENTPEGDASKRERGLRRVVAASQSVDEANNRGSVMAAGRRTPDDTSIRISRRSQTTTIGIR